MKIASIHEAAYAALRECDPAAKCAQTAALLPAWEAGALEVRKAPDDPVPLVEPGRPARPELVSPQHLAQRKVNTPEGHAALVHAIAHIEFNAINLALDCVGRYRSFPAAFHDGWLRVAGEEAAHFCMLRTRLQEMGFEYGDFPAHNGLWEMACRTADDALARMALVPRVLEARGLDATPPIIEKLRRIGDTRSVAILELILQEEIGHVALGDYWFRILCARKGLAPEATYLYLIDAFDAPRPLPPLHEAARLQAGFTRDELASLTQRREKGTPVR